MDKKIIFDLCKSNPNWKMLCRIASIIIGEGEEDVGKAGLLKIINDLLDNFEVPEGIDSQQLPLIIATFLHEKLTSHCLAALSIKQAESEFILKGQMDNWPEILLYAKQKKEENSLYLLSIKKILRGEI